MFKKYKAFSLLFLLIFIIQLIAAFYALPVLNTVIKLCIVLSLMVFFVMKTKLHGRFHKRLFTGLVFAGLADLLLMIPNSSLMLAWSCYLLVHVFYIRAFYLDFRSAQELDKKNARIAIGICTVVGMGFYVFLRPHLGTMRIPVMLFTFVACMMLMMAVFRNLRVNRESFLLIFAGVLLFVLSDCLLAIDQFAGSFPLAKLWIMASYMAAQYLIVIGGVERRLLIN